MWNGSEFLFQIFSSFAVKTGPNESPRVKAIQSHDIKNKATHGYTRPYKTTEDHTSHIRPYKVIYDYARPYKATCDHSIP